MRSPPVKPAKKAAPRSRGPASTRQPGKKQEDSATPLDDGGDDGLTATPARLIEHAISIPPYIDPKNLEALHKRYAQLGISIGPEKSALLLTDRAAEILENATPEQEYVLNHGQTPLEFLHSVYRQPLLPLSHRMNAARAILDYVHDQRPKRMSGVEGEPGLLGTQHDMANLGALGRFDPSKLSDKELAQLETLLKKGAQPDA